MAVFLRENFEVPPENPLEEALRRWRDLYRVVRNPNRRFRYPANLSKRYEAAAFRRTNQELLRGTFLVSKALCRFVRDFDVEEFDEEKSDEEEFDEEKSRLRVGFLVSKAAFRFIHGFVLEKYKPPEEVKKAGFDIDADKLSSLVSSRSYNDLLGFLGVEEIARCLKTSLDNGISTMARPPLHVRNSVFGINIFVNRPHRSLFTFTWEAMQDVTFMILMECAAISMVLGTAIEGWPKGMYDGFGIILYILLVVMTMAISDYKQHLQFHDLNEQEKKTFIFVTRDGVRQKLSIYELVVGDVVHLHTGDQVPADGIYISGCDLLVDESSLTGESGPVNVYEQNPFLLSGTKVQDGSGKMLVASAGMRTDLGKLMATLRQSGENETPLQVKLNGIATIAGKICLTGVVNK